MKALCSCFIAAAMLTSTASFAAAEESVIASIKPLHSLVAGVMAGIGEPGIIVDGAGSPHAYSLKPSQASNLQQAKLIFWVGHELEAFLEKPIETLGANARIVELMDTDGLTQLALREGGTFEAHEPEHEHDDGDHDEFDLHVWLDPSNAKTMVGEIKRHLVEADPANKDTYSSNAKAMQARIDKLTAEIETILEPVKGKSFIVFHDGYRYFENRFDAHAAGSITVSPETILGAERIAEIRAMVKKLGATCIFAEPQFEPRLVSVVMEGTNARSGVLDPLGTSIKNGPELYFTLMRNMARSMRDCLSPES